MTKTKWEKFHSAHSPIVKVNQPSTGSSNYLADWQRAASDHPDTVVHINGQKLSQHAKDFNDFKTEDDLSDFFREVILENTPVAYQESAIDYLKTSFHQGGLLNPVSAAVGDAIKVANIPAVINDTGRQNRIQIVSTTTGFKVQESLSVKMMIPYDTRADFVKQSPEYKANVEDYGSRKAQNMAYKLGSDMGKDYIIKAQATIDVDFLKSPNKNQSEPTQPSITIESNTISYGHSHLKDKMDKRSLGQCLVDFLKRALGLNKVADISPLIEASPERKVKRSPSVDEGISRSESSESNDETPPRPKFR